MQRLIDDHLVRSCQNHGKILPRSVNILQRPCQDLAKIYLLASSSKIFQDLGKISNLGIEAIPLLYHEILVDENPRLTLLIVHRRIVGGGIESNNIETNAQMPLAITEVYRVTVAMYRKQI